MPLERIWFLNEHESTYNFSYSSMAAVLSTCCESATRRHTVDTLSTPMYDLKEAWSSFTAWRACAASLKLFCPVNVSRRSAPDSAKGRNAIFFWSVLSSTCRSFQPIICLCSPSIWSRLSAVMLLTRLCLAVSSDRISPVISFTVLSLAAAFSRIVLILANNCRIDDWISPDSVNAGLLWWCPSCRIIASVSSSTCASRFLSAAWTPSIESCESDSGVANLWASDWVRLREEDGGEREVDATACSGGSRTVDMLRAKPCGMGVATDDIEVDAIAATL